LRRGYVKHIFKVIAIAVLTVFTIYSLAFLIADREVLQNLRKQNNELMLQLKRNNEDLRARIDEMGKTIEDLNKQLQEQEEKVDGLERWMEAQGEAIVDLQDRTDFLDRGGTRPAKKTMHVTAYWEGSCGKKPGHPLYGITACGEYVREWYTVAAGPDVPFGTIVYIPYFRDKPNGGFFVVKDRGSAIDNNDIDVYMTTPEACFVHGERYLDVYILGTEGAA